MAKKNKYFVWFCTAAMMCVLATSVILLLTKRTDKHVASNTTTTQRVNKTSAETQEPKHKVITINIQPLDNFNSTEPVVKGLKGYLDDLGIRNVKINVLPRKKSPTKAEIERYRDPNGNRHTRLRADSLIKWLYDGRKDVYNIGITNRDVSCTVHGVNDFGVLGLSFLNHKYNGVVVSTFRVKDKTDLWKVAAHEFSHCFFSMGHCKANDPHCIMQDANKRPNFSIKEKLCDKCKAQVKPILQKL